jgi:hypothetical protein
MSLYVRLRYKRLEHLETKTRLLYEANFSAKLYFKFQIVRSDQRLKQQRSAINILYCRVSSLYIKSKLSFPRYNAALQQEQYTQ